MIYFKPKKQVFIFLLTMVFVLPNWVVAENEGYNFTDLEIPAQDQSYYTEELWEVTDTGVYDDKGQQVDSVDEDPASMTEATPSSTPPQTQNAPSDSTDDSYSKSLINSLTGKKDQGEVHLSSVKDNLVEQQRRFEELSAKISETEDKLNPLREQEMQLQEQIDLINNQIRFTKEKITNTEVLIAEKQIQIKESLLDLQKSELEVKIQKDVVLDYIKLLYQEENKFFDLYDDSASSLKLLLSDQTVAENLVGEEYLAIMGDTGREVFNKLNKTRQDLAEKQIKILKEQEDLEFLYRELKAEKTTYEQSREGKNKLLEDTQGEEAKYELLLEEAQKEQQQAALAVQHLQNNLSMVQGALSNIGSKNLEDLSPEMLALLQSGSAAALAAGKPLAWPVTATKITAEFHDPSYPAKWGYHNAIDIRAKQYTPIMAPADAYVANVADNGLGYSYIVLAHANGLSTLYGHVSEMMVTAGSTVKQGDIIGLTGGTPGTKGAGLQTTGAHLHFEVHLNGTAVDPLNYLPVSELPLENVPDKHLADLEIEKNAKKEADHEQ